MKHRGKQQMARKKRGPVSVTVLYNDIPDSRFDGHSKSKGDPLKFEPYFAVESNTREEEIIEIVEFALPGQTHPGGRDEPSCNRS